MVGVAKENSKLNIALTSCMGQTHFHTNKYGIELHTLSYVMNIYDLVMNLRVLMDGMIFY